MTTTDAEAIARIIGRAMLDNPTDGKFSERVEVRKERASVYADEILSYLASRREAQEPVDWIYEDELPSSYPYGRMFAYSKVRDGVRMFPVYAPSPSPAPAGGFVGTVIGNNTTHEGKDGVVLQQNGTRVVHVYGLKWLRPAPPSPAPAPAGEVERFRVALEIIAGKRQCIANLMSNADVARAALNGVRHD